MKTLKTRLHSSKTPVVDRRNKEPGREWYNTSAWKMLRLEVFDRDLYRCQYKNCNRLVGNTSLLVAHHKKPHKGNKQLFFDINNLQTVCKQCHDGPIAKEERKQIWGTWY